MSAMIVTFREAGKRGERGHQGVYWRRVQITLSGIGVLTAQGPLLDRREADTPHRIVLGAAWVPTS